MEGGAWLEEGGQWRLVFKGYGLPCPSCQGVYSVSGVSLFCFRCTLKFVVLFHTQSLRHGELMHWEGLS